MTSDQGQPPTNASGEPRPSGVQPAGDPGQPVAQPTGVSGPSVARSADARPRRRNGGRNWAVLVVAVIVALIAGFLGGVLSERLFPAARTTAASAGGDNSCNSVQVADKVLPAIVTINVKSPNGDGVGTGEIIKDSGYIVTNNHVISAAATEGSISVLYSSGVSAPAKLVGRDPKSDLAVLKVTSSTPLPTVTIGKSSTIEVGQPVVALGAPLGLSGSVTAGIVSAVGRTVPVPSDNGTTAILAGAIQTDAAINPGNSGGALVDCAGDLIGVNTAIATVPNETGASGGGSVGIGFAIPVDLATSIVDQLITTGHASYPWFGVSVSAIPPAVAQRFGITDGLYVQEVVPGGPMADAGIKEGDVITSIDGRAATSADVLTQTTILRKAGDKVPVTYVRDRVSHTTTVTLETAPAPTA